MKILIIDDEPANVALLEDMLAEAGYTRVQSITDSRAALDTCSAFAPDLILLDLMMPDVSGGRMFDEMQRHPATAGIPIVVVTGKPDAHQIFDDQIGPDNVIMKPFEAETLLSRIEAHIGGPN